MNRLAKEKAAYLKHAAHQKIDWYPWSDEAFEKASREDKPVFLSTGAIWCHWCHVMAKECFEDDEIVRLLNEHFVCIKLDRDERPDVDRRYQQAVAAMGSGGGWPLSVFLTPDRKPFFGGTYFPPEDRYGRPGFRKILSAVVEYYRSKKDKVEEYSERLLSYLRQEPAVLGDIGETMLSEAEKEIVSRFDSQHGGFGAAPKFPMPGATELLINRHFYTGDARTGYVVRQTLESMAKGGFHDQIGGGFHRYSTDEAWIVPHFEKMADDNAWLLRNYVDGYALFGDPSFKEVAEGIIRFVGDVLSDPEGGFYASQDADVTPDDEGGYFTWRDEDFREALDGEEYKVLSMNLFHERGAMHHDKTKRVLFVAMEPAEIAEKTGMELTRVNEAIRSGKAKLLKRRDRRETPFIDITLYTSLNGMFAASYLKASRVLKDEGLKTFALKSIDRIEKMRFVGGELYHSEGVGGFLDDYVYLAEAMAAAYEITGRISYLDRAAGLMDACVGRFWDEKTGGFFDSREEVLGVRLKGIEDIPHPSPNSVAILLLEKLSSITGKDSYRHYALRALRAFSPKAKHFGIHGGYYFCALDAYFHSLAVSVETLPESGLAGAALSTFCPYTFIRYGEDKGYAVPCTKSKCYEPVERPEELARFLRERKG